jgi:hypothetical protein
MQEYDFVPAIGMSKKTFWAGVNKISKEQEADRILSYMHHMLRKAAEKGVSVRRDNFINYGKSVELFEGVEGWFDRINSYARERHVNVEHYIISSGIREMIEGTPIAKQFKMIYASSFMYDHHGIANWPALALNYTTKTQYLFRINKGNLHVHDDSRINEYIPKHKRPVPFENMVFIGDGETDIPCFRLVKEQGGHSIAVYKPNTKWTRANAEKLIKQERVNFVCKANYKNNSDIDIYIKAIIDKVATDAGLANLGGGNDIKD